MNILLASASVGFSGSAVAQTPAASKTTSESDCTAAKLGNDILVSSIDEPVSAVTLRPPRWNAASRGLPAFAA